MFSYDDQQPVAVFSPDDCLAQLLQKVIVNVVVYQKQKRHKYILEQRRKSITKEVFRRKYFKWVRTPKPFLSFKQMEKILQCRYDATIEDYRCTDWDLYRGMCPSVGNQAKTHAEKILQAIDQKIPNHPYGEKILIPIDDWNILLSWSKK